MLRTHCSAPATTPSTTAATPAASVRATQAPDRRAEEVGHEPGPEVAGGGDAVDMHDERATGPHQRRAVVRCVTPIGGARMGRVSPVLRLGMCPWSVPPPALPAEGQRLPLP